MSIYCEISGTSCCGLYLLENFSDRKDTYRRSMKYHIDNHERYGLYATTNNHQKAAAKALEKAGFKNCGSWYNPNSGNTVTMWLRVPKS